MAYADQGMSKGKMIGLGVAVFVHILLGYAFVTGLALKAVKTIVGTARRFRKTIIRRPRCAPRSRDAR